jgi:hypothetical protein
MKEISHRQNSSFPLPCSPALLLDYSAGKYARELRQMNQKISPADIILPWFSMLICHLEDEQQAQL